MATATHTSAVSEAAILSRLIRLDDDSLTPEAAEGLLRIQFEQRDLDRIICLGVNPPRSPWS